MGGLNPVEWLAWMYGKFFRGHPLFGGIVRCLFALVSGVIGLTLWLRAVDKFNEDHTSPKQEAAKVNIPSTEPIAASASLNQSHPPRR